ncbi:hypothetical protein KKE60_08405 [Patescibacteria group bacterium]|nr:hypothetical protein [Patescibacteria group bacterium]
MSIVEFDTVNERLESLEEAINKVIEIVEFDSVAPFDAWTDELQTILANSYKNKIELLKIKIIRGNNK